MSDSEDVTVVEDETATPDERAEATETAEEASDATPADDADDTETEDAEAGDGDEGDDEPRKRKRPGRNERRIARLEAQIEAQAMALQARETARQPETPVEPAKKPAMADFDDIEEYVEAMADWKSAAAIAQVQNANRARAGETARTRQAAETAKRRQAWMDSGEKAVAGFAEIIQDEDVPMTMTMADALVDDENGHAAALYLVEHPEEAERIAGLTQIGQARAIGRLAAKAAMPGKQRTKTPKPARTLGGGSKATPDPSKMTNEQYFEHRNKQLRVAS